MKRFNTGGCVGVLGVFGFAGIVIGCIAYFFMDQSSRFWILIGGAVLCGIAILLCVFPYCRSGAKGVNKRLRRGKDTKTSSCFETTALISDESEVSASDSDNDKI